jgi:hypothetical protein
MKLFQSVLFHGIEVPHATRLILNEEMNMGFHTNVYVYSPKLGLAFVWCDQLYYPLGRCVGIQCNCGRLRRFRYEVRVSSRHATVSCKSCGHSIQIESPPERRADGALTKSGIGCYRCLLGSSTRLRGSCLSYTTSHLKRLYI